MRDTDAATRPGTDRDTDRDAAMAVSVEEAACLARVSVRTIRRWIQHGYLPYETRDVRSATTSGDIWWQRLWPTQGVYRGACHYG